MTRILCVDAVGGAAGDMLVAALIDAGAPMSAVRDAVDAVLPDMYRVELQPATRAGIKAAYLRIEPPADATLERPPRSVAGLIAAVEAAALDDGVRAASIAVLRRLGEAEATVHGEGGGLHELGDDDTLIDVVGFAAAVRALGVDRMLVSSLPIQTGGSVPARGHGIMPLPAAATLELLRGFEIRPEAGQHETVTPTAAAILAELGKPATRWPAMRLDAVGYGAGTRDPSDRPNVVRVLLGAAEQEQDDQGAPRQRDLTVLEANLDDLTAELVADASEALLAAGALDVWTSPIQMKKGRPAVLLAALCEPHREAELRRVFFESTSTFGVRAHEVRRAELERRTVAVDVREGTVRVKVGLLGGKVVSAMPEHDDVAALARRTGRPVRAVYEEAAAEALALRLEATSGS